MCQYWRVCVTKHLRCTLVIFYGIYSLLEWNRQKYQYQSTQGQPLNMLLKYQRVEEHPLLRIVIFDDLFQKKVIMLLLGYLPTPSSLIAEPLLKW